MGSTLIFVLSIAAALFEPIHGRQVRRTPRDRGNTFGGPEHPLNGPIRHETIELQQQQPYGNMMYSKQPQGGNYGSPYRPPQDQHFQGQPHGGYRPPQGGYHRPQGYVPHQGQGHTNQGYYNQKNPLPEKPMYGPHKPVQMQPIDGGTHKGYVDNYEGGESGKHHTGDGYAAKGADSEYGSVDQNYDGNIGQEKASYESAGGSYEQKNEYVTNAHVGYQPPKKKAPEIFCKTGDITQFYPVFCDEWLRPGDRCSVLCGAGSNQDSFLCLNHLNYGTCDAVCKSDGSWHVPCACNTATLEKKIRGAEQDGWYMEPCFVGDVCPNIGCGDNLCVKDEITCDAQNGLTGSCACQPLISERYNNINDDNSYICEGVCVGDKCPANELCEKGNVPTNNLFERDSAVCTLNGWAWEDSGDALPLPDERDDEETLCRPPQCVCKDDSREIESPCNDGCGEPCDNLCGKALFCDKDPNSNTYLQCISSPDVCVDTSLSGEILLARDNTASGMLVERDGYLDICGDDAGFGGTANGLLFRYDSMNIETLRVGTCEQQSNDAIVAVYECGSNGLICVGLGDDNCADQGAYVEFLAEASTRYIILVKSKSDTDTSFVLQIAQPAECLESCPSPDPSIGAPCILCDGEGTDLESCTCRSGGFCYFVRGECTCFSASSTVTVLHESSTKTIRLDELIPGDLVMSVDNQGNIFFDEFYAESHAFPETGSQRVGTFTRFNFDGGYIDLSSTHIAYSSPTRLGVPIDNCIDYNGEKICAYVSNKLEVGDTLWTIIDGELIPKNISHISYTQDKIRAPKLLHGNLVVNGVVSSSFTSHHNANHAMWLPWRLLYKIHPSIMDVKFLHILWDTQIRRSPQVFASKHDWFARHATEFVYLLYTSVVGLITWVFYQVYAQKQKK